MYGVACSFTTAATPRIRLFCCMHSIQQIGVPILKIFKQKTAYSCRSKRFQCCYTGKNAHKNSHTLPFAQRYTLHPDRYGWFPGLWLTGRAGTRTPSQGKTPMANCSFHRQSQWWLSRRILTDASQFSYVSIGTILRIFSFYKSYFTTKKQKCNRKIVRFLRKYCTT